MSRRDVTAIVLAGGRSSRFGRDKLVEPIDGRPLLDHAIDAIRPVASRILIVVAPDATPSVPPDATVVHDPTPFEGPLAGLLAGLGAASDPVVLATGGDTPNLVVDVVESMLAALDSAAVDAVVLEHDGRARPLPIVLRREPALVAATDLYTRGERRLRALIEVLATHVVPESAWRSLDPDAVTLRDIDTPADLP
jgi:molybdopterin-guanine dinucleotide biosynthesis protein A